MIPPDEFDLLLDYLVSKIGEMAKLKNRPAQFGNMAALHLLTKLRAAGWCPKYEAEKMPEFEQYLRDHRYALPPKNPKAELEEVRLYRP